MENSSNRRRTLVILGVALLAGLALSWFCRSSILTWWYLRNLKQADAEELDHWAERTASLGVEVVPSLCDALREESETSCSNVGVALEKSILSWGKNDSRTLELLNSIETNFDSFSTAGQVAVMNRIESGLTHAEANETWSSELTRACAQLLARVTKSSRGETLAPALELSAVLLTLSLEKDELECCRSVIRAGLKAESANVRVRSIQLALRPRIELFEEIAGLLRDPTVAVRQAALLAVGPARDHVTDEVLLPSLIDKDAEVRKLGEAALRARGLSSDHLRMGRLLIDPDPKTRLKVLGELRNHPELDQGVWLRRLSHDPADSVRAASVRIMGSLPDDASKGRLNQMARSDPSQTVSKLARYYLKKRTQRD